MPGPRQSVFINCPFDGGYLPLFRAIVFTVLRCSLEPRCALEVVDSGGTRISKIEKLIEDCPLGIHDISRTELDELTGLPRFNMPLELGLFLGAKRFGDSIQRKKRCLVMDSERYRFQKFMSDIAGQDIEAHGNDADEAIKKVRSFLNNANAGAPLSSGSIMAADYRRFDAALPTICARLDLDKDKLDYADFVWIAREHISTPPAT